MENNPWHDLYSNHADRYDRVVEGEDYQGHLLPALRELAPMEDATLVDLGAGTGETQPGLPARFRAAYEYFESEWQFSSRWVQTDYCFPTMDEAHQVLSLDFGEAMVERTYTSETGIILPEWTGIWWRSV